MTRPNLKGCVILGYTDLNAAGSRTLLGMDICMFSTSPLRLPSLADQPLKQASVNQTVAGLEAAVLLCEHKTKDFSLIILNTVVEPCRVHVVANEIIDMVARGKTRELIVLSALSTGSRSAVLKITSNDPDSAESQNLCCSDPFLNALLQFAKVERFAMTIVAVDGRRAQKGIKANSFDGSQQAIEALLQYLTGELQLEISADQSLSWVLSEDTTYPSEDIPMFI